MKNEIDGVRNEAGQHVSEDSGAEEQWREGDLRFCDSLYRSVKKKQSFEATSEELRSLAFQYLYRHYRFQAICLSASVGSWEGVEESFALHRFAEITDVLCPGGLTYDLVSFIADADAEIAKIRADNNLRKEGLVPGSCDESAGGNVFEKGGVRRYGGDWDLRFSCASLHQSVEKTMSFEVTTEELRSLAFQYLDRHYELQADCIRAAVGGWEYEEKAFAWHRFEEITDALCPEELADEFVDRIADAEGEMVRLKAEEGDLLMYYTSRAGDYRGKS